jgi:hypothetical protein
LTEWLEDLWIKGYKFNVNFTDSDDHDTSLCAVLPEHIDDALNSLNMKSLKNIRGLELINILEKAVFDPKAHESFKRFTATLDRVRETRVTDLDDRFNEYIKEASV